ncbi:uro-adherence factor A-like isoform X2 [Prorops nasuta]|uniref:uro-adherence factor A-like isoform X2 n=1 Tax=Prorops nasuta TaxID=863751 RepID=UPI0034CF606A
MQWRRQRRVHHVIGSSNHVLLLVRYQDAPPGEEDDEEKLCNGFGKGQDRSSSGTYGYDRNGQGGFKPRRSSARTTAANSNGTGSGSGTGSSRSRREDGSDSLSQPKIMFNEEEYTRITTPRQDMLFKKGYLSRKKPWTSNASTSATPSTTESQSASHSTADGSETTEDQQLLDRDSRSGEFLSSAPETLGAQISYGTFYDHSSGYYYEYPVMLVGPAPIPAQMEPGVLAAMPCTSLPLRPIEWVNPAFVPKLSGQSYCLMDYQSGQSTECTPLTGEQGCTTLPAETGNNSWNESGTGSASCSGSVAGEAEEQTEELNTEEVPLVEESCIYNNPYVEPPIIQQAMPIPHVVPAGVPQPYIYPGHYMFGPSLVNINGVTIQSGPMMRSTDAAAAEAYAKRRKKKKRRKQRRPAMGNTEDEDEEEGEYSSECENGLPPSSRLPWSVEMTSGSSTTTGNRPLNPEVQEFQPCSTNVATSTSEDVSNEEKTPSITNHESDRNSWSPGVLDSVEKSLLVPESRSDCSNSIEKIAMTLENEIDSTALSEAFRDAGQTGELRRRSDEESHNEENVRLNDCPAEEEEPVNSTKETLDSTGDAHISEGITENSGSSKKILSSTQNNEEINGGENNNGIVDEAEDSVANRVDIVEEEDIEEEGGKKKKKKKNRKPDVAPSPTVSSPDISEKACLGSSTPKTDLATKAIGKGDVQRLSLKSSSAVKKASVSSSQRRKYSGKTSKLVREATPGLDLDESVDTRARKEPITGSNGSVSNGAIPNGKPTKKENELPNGHLSQSSDDLGKTKSANDAGDGSLDDSGFESQTVGSHYPITEAVTEWLRKSSSPEIFKTYEPSTESETENDYDEEIEERIRVEANKEPPKNLQGNPMPALSANGGADNVELSGSVGCSKFARVNDVVVDESEDHCEALAKSRKKRGAKGARGKKGRKVDEEKIVYCDKASNSLLSPSDCKEDRVEGNSLKREIDGIKGGEEEGIVDFCEFAQKDRDVGMRVASSSRISSNRANARRRTRRIDESRLLVENIDVKMRVIGMGGGDNEDDEGIVEDTICVRTFEKGEIVVSVDGKLLPVSAFQPFSNTSDDVTEIAKDVRGNGPVEGEGIEEAGEPDCMIVSLESIEEPDVLECWEAETIEPVITPKRILQSQGIFCRGEAEEDDVLEVDASNLAHVQKYYRLAREITPSIEKEPSIEKVESRRSVPNCRGGGEMVNGFCHANASMSAFEEIGEGKCGAEESSSVPIDEAFEAYESCYTGSGSYFPEAKLPHSGQLYNQDGEGPVPCKTVCCSIQ